MSRPWYNIFRTYEEDDLFQDEEVEKAIEKEDEAWFNHTRHEGRIREVE